jgi:hypothetical protein
MAADYTITATDVVLQGGDLITDNVSPANYWDFTVTMAPVQWNANPSSGGISDRPANGYLFPRGNRFP